MTEAAKAEPTSTSMAVSTPGHAGLASVPDTVLETLIDERRREGPRTLVGVVALAVAGLGVLVTLNPLPPWILGVLFYAVPISFIVARNRWSLWRFHRLGRALGVSRAECEAIRGALVKNRGASNDVVIAAMRAP